MIYSHVGSVIEARYPKKLNCHLILSALLHSLRRTFYSEAMNSTSMLLSTQVGDFGNPRTRQLKKPYTRFTRVRWCLGSRAMLKTLVDGF